MDLDKMSCNNNCDTCGVMFTVDNIYSVMLDKIKIINVGSDEFSTNCSEKNSFIRLSRYTAGIFKNLSIYINMYNDIISEMISSHTSYPNIIFYILDVKFIAWKKWLEILLFWNRYLGVHCLTCKQYKEVIKKISDLTNKTAIDAISVLETDNEKDEKIKNLFIKTHSEIYKMFMDDLLKILILPPSKNGDYHYNIRTITDIICSWMSVSVFELLSIESILSKKKMLISRSIITKILDGYDIISVFKNNNLEIDDYIFTTPELYKFKYMFSDNKE